MHGNASDKSVNVGPFVRIRPRVNFANYMASEPGQTWGPRTIPDCQMVCLLSGRAEFILAGIRHQLTAGQGVFYGSESGHVLTSSEVDPMTFCSVHFVWHSDSLEPVDPVPGIRTCSWEDVNRAATEYRIDLGGNHSAGVPHVFSTIGLEPWFIRLAEEYRNEELGYSLVMQSLLCELIARILRNTVKPYAQPDKVHRIEPALEAIRTHPERNWTISQLAHLCGYQTHYFAHVFKTAVGHSPKHFIMLERIRVAKMLLTLRRTLDEVAVDLGYSSVHYFCRQFKQVTGTTPATFRRRHLEL